MTDKELRRLSRMELIQLLWDQARELERVRKELAEAKAALDDRRILISQSGSIAEAALQINRVMEAAQNAADLYVENVENEYRLRQEELEVQLAELERDTQERCAQMLEEARRKANGYGEDEGQ